MARKKDVSLNKKGKKTYHGVLFLIAFLLTLLCISTGSRTTQVDTVQVGAVAEKRYVADRDAIDEVTTERLKEAAADSVAPIYMMDSVAEEESRTEVNEMFQELNRILLKLKDDESFYKKAMEAPWKLPVVLTEKQLNAYANLDGEKRTFFAEDCLNAMNGVYETGVKADALEAGRTAAAETFGATAWNSTLKTMAEAVLDAALKPNLVLDDDAMDAAREAKRAEVDNVMIRKNQKIVDEGEIITQDIYDRLVSLDLIGGAEYTGRALPLAGSLLMAGIVFGALYLFFTWGKGIVVLKYNEVKMLFVVYIIMVILMRLMANIQYFTLIPLGLFAMLVSMLIGRRVAIIMNSLFCIIGCLIFNGDVIFLMYTLLVGTMGALLIQKTDQRKYIMPVSGVMALISFISMFSAGLFFENGYSAGLLVQSLFGAAMGIVSVIIAVGSLPFWEAAFEANTPHRLLELTNPNNELLRRLMIEAPGTYHHSLIVANLAETAAYEIGANTALARAGAYYHDIGKLKHPQMFSENQAGYNIHDDLSPETSAKLITQHPKTGVEMGLEYGLPRVIIDIIREHHGTGLVKYFYFKALKEYGADKVTEEEYRYQGTIPSSRESAIVMLADTVEAAVRSVLGKGQTLEEAEALVKTLMKDKLDDDQLDNSGLGIHELEIIRKAFIKVFHGMYHERVAYPKQEEIAAAKLNIALEEPAEENREEENSESTD